MKKALWIFIVIAGIISVKYELGKNSNEKENNLIDKEFFEICQNISSDNFGTIINSEYYCSCITKLMKSDEELTSQINKIKDKTLVKNIYANFYNRNGNSVNNCMKKSINNNSKDKINFTPKMKEKLFRDMKSSYENNPALENIDKNEFYNCLLNELVSKVPVEQLLTGIIENENILFESFMNCSKVKKNQ